MKLFLDIGKSQQELILAIILACPIVSMLLLLGLGLSDTTYQGMSSDHIIPFLNNKFSLTKNAFVVAQFIAPLTFTFVRSSNSH